jgi:hypothetical protein
MENQNEEYQCSDCGVAVSADTKICPNCGASLEDISEEETSKQDEFAEIPVTSHPADLSSILSLLDEKKIEYFINNDAMENIWGQNFIQIPRLLVHNEQVEEVKEIINSIHEEVEVIDNDVFKKENSEQVDTKGQIKGVEGWLLFFSMMLIFTPIAYIPYSIDTYIEIQNEVIWFPFKDALIIIDLVSNILISCLSIYAGLKLWRIRPGAIKATELYLNIFLVYSLIIFLMITMIFSISKLPFNTAVQYVYGDMIRETISSIAFVIVWKLYLKNSERVKNTYSVQ